MKSVWLWMAATLISISMGCTEPDAPDPVDPDPVPTVDVNSPTE